MRSASAHQVAVVKGVAKPALWYADNQNLVTLTTWGGGGCPPRLWRSTWSRYTRWRRGDIVCIEAEEEELLAYVQQLGLVPGAMVEVNDFAPFGGPVELTVDGGRIFVGVPVAERVLIGIVEDD